jgi:2-polyprenyl-3-methyl-5-hydroxy-6-metoxy-1,4-benzoquinol methylase
MAGDGKPGDGAERAHQYAPYLPKDRGALILDLGFGGGWFVAACLKLGYEKIYGGDFGIAHKQHVREWAPDRITLFDIPNDIGEFLSDKQEQFEFIHLSHVIEHVPKYLLLWVATRCIGLCGAGVPCCCARRTWKGRARIRRYM